MRFIITIDTEADNQWNRESGVLVENLKYIPRFQALCDRYNFKPTYLCTYEIVQDNHFEKFLVAYQNDGRAEIGAHLHPWTNPPFENRHDASSETDRAAYPSELPLDLFRLKMNNLTELITKRTGKRPTSYRAGRWGFDKSHIEVLLELGYLVDTSVTPYTSWQRHAGNKQGGPDFRSAGNESYRLNNVDVCQSGDSQLYEVPTTITPTSSLFDIKVIEKIYRQFLKFKIGKKISRKLALEPLWFRPYPQVSANELINIYKAMQRRKSPVIQMMFHSSELMPGGSPYNVTNESIEELYDKFESLFSYIAMNGGKGCTLTEYTKKISSLKN